MESKTTSKWLSNHVLTDHLGTLGLIPGSIICRYYVERNKEVLQQLCCRIKSHCIIFRFCFSHFKSKTQQKEGKTVCHQNPQKICRQKLCFNVWIRNNIKIWKKLLSVTPTPTLVALQESTMLMGPQAACIFSTYPQFFNV